jgi:hypothetical protein
LIGQATHLRLQLEPKLKLSFNPNAEGMGRTPTKVYEPSGKELRTDEAIYIRITLDCLSKATVKDCVAFITKIEKKLPNSETFSTIRMYGAIPLLSQPREVYANIPATIDFLKTGKYENKLDCAVPLPFVLEDVFKGIATYRIIIRVNSAGITQEIQVDVDWTGDWGLGENFRSRSHTIVQLRKRGAVASPASASSYGITGTALR